MKFMTKLSAGVCLTALVSTSAFAGGFDRGGVNIDQLFDAGNTVKGSVTHVMPQREIKNVQRQGNDASPFLPGASDAKISVDNDYTTGSGGVKLNLGSGFDCLASYSKPYGAYANYGTDNAYSASAVEFEVETDNYAFDCSYQYGLGANSLGESYIRLIGGVSYQELEGFQSRQRFLDLANAGVLAAGGITNSAGLGTFQADGDAVGFRLGVAYEIPAIALRAVGIYHSKYDYDLKGVQDNSGFGALIPGSVTVPITASTEIPQAFELKLQSGINERTLGFLNVKWQQWSNLGIIPIEGGRSPVDGQPTPLSFDPEYRDGWTIQGGVGRVLTEDLSALAAIGWDRGTSTTTGTQTDTWTLSAGISYKPSEEFEINLGGLVGVLTSGSSKVSPFGDAANAVTYDFDNDIVTAVSVSGKLKF